MWKSGFPFKRMSKIEKERFRHRIFDIIFETNTPQGKLFNIALLFVILLSVILVMLDTIPSVNARYHKVLNVLEYVITILFTIEFCLRIYALKKPWKYIFSFYGLIDILAILPFYIGIFVPAGRYLSNIRILRLLRVFRIFKLTEFTHGRNVLLLGLKESRNKIIVFLFVLYSINFVFLIVPLLVAINKYCSSVNASTGITAETFSSPSS